MTDRWLGKEALELLDEVLAAVNDETLDAEYGDSATAMGVFERRRDNLVTLLNSQRRNVAGVVARRRRVSINVTIDTNMDPSELGSLAEGSFISIAEFGKEHIEMPRYEQVVLEVIDADYTVLS